ncbi:hypothetical protein G6F43_012150 [Rhizopus delemar]|nr:hypothetical protein G6F43_012150 [Rhizopus delemar]
MNPSTKLPALVTAPNKTFTKRPSNSSYSSATSPLPLELADTFSQLSIQRTFQSNKSPTAEHRSYFNTLQLSSIRPICSSSQVYDWSFLSTEKYPACYSSQDMYDLEMTTLGLSIELAANNTRTRNLNRLVNKLIDLLKQTVQQKHTDVIPVETYNALFLTRVFMKHFADNLTNKEIMEQIEDHPNECKAEQLLESLLYILMNMDPNTSYACYEFYVEILNMFLTLFSTQLRNPLKSTNYFLDIFMSRFVNRADAVVARLLENVINQHHAPPQSNSVMYTAYSYIFSSSKHHSSSSSHTDTIPVPDLSLFLLLLLGVQSKGINSEWITCFRQAIAGLSDHHVLSATDIDGCDYKMHLISFKELLEMFIKSFHVEEKMLLFYMILAENESFRVYVLSRTDQETIYIPILKLIYESIEGKGNYSQVYILMTLLLILSQDEVNNDAIQKISVQNMAWFTERPLLKSISLGGLTMLVMIRTLQLNLSVHRDIYLHTNCLAILANMSSTILDMHAYTAQRLISLFELLTKRYLKLVDKEQPSEDTVVYEDVLMFMLEIINSILSHRLKHNLQLVYALLLKREIFIPFQSHSRLSETANNLDQVITYFSSRVSEANLKAPSSSEVLNIIEHTSRTWSNQRMKSLPELKFQYEEESDAFEFFIPYVWSLILRKDCIYWSEEKCRVLDSFALMNEEPDTPTIA